MQEFTRFLFLTSNWLFTSIGGHWGVVCDKGWDMADAQVVCRQMRQAGARRALKGRSVKINTGSKGIITWMKGVVCTGEELKLEVLHHGVVSAWSVECFGYTLQDCQFDGWTRSTCNTTELAGVECCM